MTTINPERAAIIEYFGGLPRAEAERLAIVQPAAPVSCLPAALAYARRGWRVIPLNWPKGKRCSCGRPKCAAIGKHPLLNEWQRQATTDPRAIRAWWERWPAANVGIATGAESGIIVLDVDSSPDKRGDLTLVDRVWEAGPLDHLYHVITGSGGSHYYLKHPGVHTPNGVNALGRGLDIRGDGGQVVAPPSLHASGSRYCWAETWSTGDPTC